MACENGNNEVIKDLIDHGANIYKEGNDYKGKSTTPIISACNHLNSTTIDYIFEHGTKVKHSNKKSRHKNDYKIVFGSTRLYY